MENKTAIELLPENHEVIKVVANRRPSWFLRFGGYVAVCICLLFISIIIYLFIKYKLIEQIA